MSQQQTSGLKCHPLLLQLKQADEKLSSKCFLAANNHSPMASWRSTMILLEYSAHGIPWLLVDVLLVWFVTDRELCAFYINLFLALCIDLIAVACVKSAARRKRPVVNRQDMFFTVSIDKLSFPSGHASRTAMLSCIIILKTSVFPVFKLASVLWCAAVAGSRVLLGRHYIGDVCGGIILGVIEYLVIVTLFWMNSETALYIASYFTSFASFHVGNEGVEL
ncbi:polyisoprenoid diphosphate/phosphate phosphohydrolase PLPP6-like [Ornithodoros turicata]|uniref:polyisoprenoid diphosphate/phosphate phosphohydrolase PLPP6-like n=1 Tax=Ornithodoros turicata TaxID=34597 RepID=UPI003139FAD7